MAQKWLFCNYDHYYFSSKIIHFYKTEKGTKLYQFLINCTSCLSALSLKKIARAGPQLSKQHWGTSLPLGLRGKTLNKLLE
jgi:hypothetical protein